MKYREDEILNEIKNILVIHTINTILQHKMVSKLWI
jgi:hypothetical protein